MTRTESVFDRLALRTGRALVDWSQRPDRTHRAIDPMLASPSARTGLRSQTDSLSTTRFH